MDELPRPPEEPNQEAKNQFNHCYILISAETKRTSNLFTPNLYKSKKLKLCKISHK